MRITITMDVKDVLAGEDDDPAGVTEEGRGRIVSSLAPYGEVISVEKAADA